MRVVGQKEIAELFGVTARSITEWQADGMPVAVQGGPGVPGEYDAPACIRWLVEREVRKVQGENPRSRLDRLRGDELEMNLARERGKLIEAGAIEPAMRAAIVSARERVRSEPEHIATALEGKSKAEQVALLRDLFDEVLAKLSRWQQPGEQGDDDERAV